MKEVAAPMLSVLIGARDAAATIEGCLASLEVQLNELVEVVVADGSADDTADRIARRFPWVHLVRCQPMSAGELLREAFKGSNGKLVALAAPHVTFAPTWVDAALASPRHGTVAVGGAVAPGPSSVCGIGAWAAFLCEYSDFLPPLDEGPAMILTGNNVIYQRAVLEESDLRDGLEKTWVNQGLARRGARFWRDPALVVVHDRPYRFRTFLAKRFHHGRCYGAKRARGWPRHRRLGRALISPLLPALLGFRIIRAVAPKRQYLRHLLLAQPLLALFHASWAIGEGWGYLTGPGDSCARVY